MIPPFGQAGYIRTLLTDYLNVIIPDSEYMDDERALMASRALNSFLKDIYDNGGVLPNPRNAWSVAFPNGFDARRAV